MQPQENRMDEGSSFWSDERCVPADHPDSNYFNVKLALLISLSCTEIHRMAGELEPSQAAKNMKWN
jgi:6-phosphogluconolactonase